MKQKMGIVSCWLIGMGFAWAMDVVDIEEGLKRPSTHGSTDRSLAEIVKDLTRVEELVEEKIEKLVRADSYYEGELALIKDKHLKLKGIALFAGRDISSGIIRSVTKSSWSHCGLILVDQDQIGYCFESTGSYDEIINKGVLPRVQINLWDRVVADYDGNVAMRDFVFMDETLNTAEIVNKLVMTYLNRPYECNLDQLLGALAGMSKESDLTSIFCSELVAQVLIDMTYLPAQKLSDNYLPRDFSKEMTLEFVNMSLGDELFVKNLTPEEVPSRKKRKWFKSCFSY